MSNSPMAIGDRSDQIKQFFETMTPQSLQALDSIYSSNAWFKDPFNEVTGLHAIEKIYRHMFVQVQKPHFVIHDVVQDHANLFLTWDFRFTSGGGIKTVRGASHLRLSSHGLIDYHRDYWDVAEELYEKIPLLGLLMRFLKRRLSS